MKIERRARWDRLWLPVDVVLRKIETLYWHMRGLTVIECFGDSHVKVFRRLNWMYPELPVRFRTISVMGATAYGVTNYNSASSAREIYESRLRWLPKNHKALVLLGEIDAGFLIWSLAEKKGLDVDEVLLGTVEHYAEFLAYVKSMNDHMFVCSAPLPTVDGGGEEPAYLAVRGTINVGKKERTDMTLEFNGLVQKRCNAIGAEFIDLDSSSLDQTSGLVKEELINPSALDHHYEENAYARILRERLLAMGVFRNGMKVS